jgi:Holliday junction resolvase
MPKRSKTEQSAHDRKVRQLSRDLRKDGYEVRADVRGYKRPHPVGKAKLRPDIVAKKSGATRIIEVETPRSLVRDREQLKTFTRSASHRKRTTLDVVVTRPRKTKRS